MGQLTTKDKINRGLPVIDNKFIRTIRKLFIAPPLLLCSRFKIKYKVVKTNKYQKIKDIPAIYIVNHYRSQDTPIVCNYIKEHAYILAGKQKLKPEDELFFKGYGSIFVDRKDKEDTGLSKIPMTSYLNQKESLIVFPEATWCLDEALLTLPIKWGAIGLAQDTGAQIITIDLNYDDENKKCYITYGEPQFVDNSEDKAKRNEDLRNKMAEQKWYQLEKKEILERSKIDVEELRKEHLLPLEEYPELDYEYEQAIIFEPHVAPEDVFEPIKKLELKKENAFLFHKNNIGIR